MKVVFMWCALGSVVKKNLDLSYWVMQNAGVSFSVPYHSFAEQTSQTVMVFIRIQKDKDWQQTTEQWLYFSSSFFSFFFVCLTLGNALELLIGQVLSSSLPVDVYDPLFLILSIVIEKYFILHRMGVALHNDSFIFCPASFCELFYLSDLLWVSSNHQLVLNSLATSPVFIRESVLRISLNCPLWTFTCPPLSSSPRISKRRKAKCVYLVKFCMMQVPSKARQESYYGRKVAKATCSHKSLYNGNTVLGRYRS